MKSSAIALRAARMSSASATRCTSIEQEGTYPLPEAQLDRFMLKVRVGYPTRDAEKEIVARMASGRPIEVQRIAEADDILAARSAIAELFMDQKVVDYIVDVVRGTREPH